MKTGFERKLKNLFEAQDFFRNPKLDAIIDSVPKREARGIRELADSELEMLYAAGDPNAVFTKAKEKESFIDDK